MIREEITYKKRLKRNMICRKKKQREEDEKRGKRMKREGRGWLSVKKVECLYI